MKIIDLFSVYLYEGQSVGIAPRGGFFSTSKKLQKVDNLTELSPISINYITLFKNILADKDNQTLMGVTLNKDVLDIISRKVTDFSLSENYSISNTQYMQKPTALSIKQLPVFQKIDCAYLKAFSSVLLASKNEYFAWYALKNYSNLLLLQNEHSCCFLPLFL